MVKRSEIDQKGKRGEQSRGGLDKFWSKEVKLTKKRQRGRKHEKVKKQGGAYIAPP